jgi:hypothetical protein
MQKEKPRGLNARDYHNSARLNIQNLIKVVCEAL